MLACFVVVVSVVTVTQLSNLCLEQLFVLMASHLRGAAGHRALSHTTQDLDVYRAGSHTTTHDLDSYRARSHRPGAPQPAIGSHLRKEFIHSHSNRLIDQPVGSCRLHLRGSGFVLRDSGAVTIPGSRRQQGLSRRTPPAAGMVPLRGSAISLVGHSSWQIQAGDTMYESSNDRAGYGGPRTRSTEQPTQRPSSSRPHSTPRAGSVGPAYAAWLMRQRQPADFPPKRPRSAEQPDLPPPPPPLWWYDQPIGPRVKSVPRAYVRGASSLENELVADEQKLADKHLKRTLRPWPDKAGQLVVC